MTPGAFSGGRFSRPARPGYKDQPGFFLCEGCNKS